MLAIFLSVTSSKLVRFEIYGKVKSLLQSKESSGKLSYGAMGVQQVKERLRWFAGRKALWSCAIGTPQSDGKREGCVYREQRYIFYFEQSKFTTRKSWYIAKPHYDSKKQVDFLAKTLLFCILLPTFFEKVATQTAHHSARFLRAYERASERTRTCTSRTQQVCFFCLHLHP